ncbi:MAG: hypothetical protein ACJ75F_12355 [Flavisolibacter sp.]
MNSKLIVSALLSLIAVQISQIEPPAAAQSPVTNEASVKQSATESNFAFSRDKNSSVSMDIKLTRNASGNNELSWTISQTTKTESFLIQRSENGKEFRLIGRRTPQENKYVYSFEDAGFKNDAYYRLIEIDVDGKVSYSNSVKNQ